MKKIIIALLVIAVAFYAMSDRDENIVFIKNTQQVFLKLNIAPFSLSHPVRLFVLASSLGRLMQKLFSHQLAHWPPRGR